MAARTIVLLSALVWVVPGVFHRFGEVFGAVLFDFGALFGSFFVELLGLFGIPAQDDGADLLVELRDFTEYIQLDVISVTYGVGRDDLEGFLQGALHAGIIRDITMWRGGQQLLS